jgi:hypothetical protein
MSAHSVPTTGAAGGLPEAIDAVETRLAMLSDALRENDGRGIDAAALDVQRALALTLDRFQRARAPLSPAMRQRLMRASAGVAAQRESLGRASASLDRAMNVLLPREAAVYNAQGATDAAKHSGVARA